MNKNIELFTDIEDLIFQLESDYNINGCTYVFGYYRYINNFKYYYDYALEISNDNNCLYEKISIPELIYYLQEQKI